MALKLFIPLREVLKLGERSQPSELIIALIFRAYHLAAFEFPDAGDAYELVVFAVIVCFGRQFLVNFAVWTQ
jgi:hypothetical protein